MYIYISEISSQKISHKSNPYKEELVGHTRTPGNTMGSSGFKKNPKKNSELS